VVSACEPVNAAGVDVTRLQHHRIAAPLLEMVRPRTVVVACMLICMQSTSVRIDVATHEELKRLADELETTVGNTVSLAVRALRQDRAGEELRTPLREDETAWLDADLG
jgi:hypothetical protein